MKLTNTELLTAADALSTVVKLRLPVRTSYRVAKLAKAVQRAAEPYDTTKAKILEEHGTPIEGQQGRFTLSDEGVAEHNELLGLEATVDGEPLTLDDLGEIDIEPATLIGLGPLLKDE